MTLTLGIGIFVTVLISAFVAGVLLRVPSCSRRGAGWIALAMVLLLIPLNILALQPSVREGMLLQLLALTLFLVAAAPPSLPTHSILAELSAAEGSDIRLPFPYELKVSTFSPDEGSIGSGPRILIITNGMESPQAIGYVHGKRTVLELTSRRDDSCDEGHVRSERFEAPGVLITTWFETSPGEESCWVVGTIRVTVGTETQTYRVKASSGL